MDRTGENVERLDVNRYGWKRALGASGPSRTNLSLSSASGNNTLLYLVCQMSDRSMQLSPPQSFTFTSSLIAVPRPPPRHACYAGGIPTDTSFAPSGT